MLSLVRVVHTLEFYLVSSYIFFAFNDVRMQNKGIEKDEDSSHLPTSVGEQINRKES